MSVTMEKLLELIVAATTQPAAVHQARHDDRDDSSNRAAFNPPAGHAVSTGTPDDNGPSAASYASSSGPPAAAAVVASCQQRTTYRPEEYLDTAKKYTPAKSKFRHALRRAAQQCRAWGQKTLKELTPGELAHIHKEVVNKCPELAGWEREVEGVLSTSLIQAKSYKNCNSDKGEASDCNGKNKKSKKNKKRKGGKVHMPKKNKRRKMEENDDDDDDDDDLDTSDDEEEATIYATRKQEVPTRKENRKKPIKTTVAAEAGGSRDPEEFTPGCELIVTDKKTDVGLGRYLYKNNDVYVNVQFSGLLNDIAKDVELPMPCKGKTTIGELEENDIFLWKASKLRSRKRRSVPNKKYL